MVQSPSWAANRLAASEEIPRISRNPDVHYRTHKRPPPVSVLGQPNPVHIPTSHLLEMHPNIIHPSTPRSPQWSLSLRFPHQDPIHPPLLTHTRHMPSPSHYVHCTISLIQSMENLMRRFANVIETCVHCCPPLRHFRLWRCLPKVNFCGILYHVAVQQEWNCTVFRCTYTLCDLSKLR